MSYEGHIQFLCKQGHYWEEGYMYGEEQGFCPTCKEVAVWSNSVDDTNCDNSGEIDMAAFLVKPAEKCVCSCCGHEHKKGQDIYRIPNPYETARARKFWDSHTERWIPCTDRSRPVVRREYLGKKNYTIVEVELTPNGPKILEAVGGWPEKVVKLTKAQEKQVLEAAWPGYKA